MNIDNLTIKEAKAQLIELQELFKIEKPANLISTLGTIESIKQIPVEIGQAYLFRTVTHIEVGRVKGICGVFIELEEASWIADTGRYHDCLKNGTFSEVEPYPLTTTINSSSLINFAPWPHDLPKEQK